MNMTFDFFPQIIELNKIPIRQKEYVISGQFLNSAADTGANMEETKTAQTKNNFITKISVTTKEARKTKYLLRLLDKNQLLKHDDTDWLNKTEYLIYILNKILK